MSTKTGQTEMRGLLNKLPLCEGMGKEHQFVARLLELCCEHPGLAVDYYHPVLFDGWDHILTPLESLFLCKVSMDAIQEFCERHPKALQVESRTWNGLPLHVACTEFNYRHLSKKLIPYLVERYPKAVSTRDKNGNLPIHNLLCGYSCINVYAIEYDEILIPSVEALVQFPESFAQRSHDVDGGRTILELVLSRRFSPGVVATVLRNYAQHTTSFTFESCRRLFTEGQMFPAQHAQMLGKFFSTLERVELRAEGRWNNQDSPIGWTSFFQGFQYSRTLEYLEIYIPSLYLFLETNAVYAIEEALSKLMALKTLIVSCSSTFGGTPTRSDFDICRLFVSLLSQQTNTAGGKDLETLIVRESRNIEMNPEPIIQAIIHNSYSLIQTLDIRCFSTNVDMTELLADLIANNKVSLETLYLKRIQFQQQPIFEALSRNTHIKSLSLPNIIEGSCNTDADDTAVSCNNKSLSSVLRHFNITLTRVQCLDASFAEIEGIEYKRIQHYALLNRFGRGFIRLETFSCLDLIGLLQTVFLDPNLKQVHREHDRLSACYDLLREAPGHWCIGC